MSSEYQAALALFFGLLLLILGVTIGILISQLSAIAQAAFAAVLSLVTLLVVVILGVLICLVVIACAWNRGTRKKEEIGRRKRRASDCDSFRGPAGSYGLCSQI